MAITAEIDLTLPPTARLPEHGVYNQLNAMELSKEEMDFLLDNLESSPHRALAGWEKAVPHNPEPEHGARQSFNQWCIDHPGVNPKGMERILARLREVEEVHPQSFGYYERSPQMAPLIGKPVETYTGLEAIRQCILDAQEYNKRFARIKKDNPAAAIHPSLYMRDGRGKLHYQGPGSDQGVVRKFTCWILHENTAQVDPAWAAAAASDQVIVQDAKEATKQKGAGSDFKLIEGPNYFECCIEGCNHREDFQPEDDRSRNLAKGRLARHYTIAKTSKEDHREAKVVIFG